MIWALPVAQGILSVSLLAAAGSTAEAERLFRSGRQALDQRKYAEARDKFEASFRLYPGTGVKLNLGTVYVALDELEKAEAMFRAAETEASANGETTRLTLAREGLLDVEKHKARLVFRFAPALPDAAEVQLDGKAVPRADALSKVPVIKGRHALRVKMSGEPAHEQTVDVAANGVAQTVDVNLPASWAPSKVVPPGSGDAHAGDTQRTVAYVVGGIGLAALVTNGVFLGLYGSEHDWKTDTQEKRDRVNLHTYIGIASAAVLATGAVLYFTAPKNGQTSAFVTVTPTYNGAAAVLGGKF